MNEHIGELGYPSTDFNFIKSCLNDFSDFDKESKADEGMRQVVIQYDDSFCYMRQSEIY